MQDIVGVWFRADVPEHRMPGTLTIQDDGTIRPALIRMFGLRPGQGFTSPAPLPTCGGLVVAWLPPVAMARFCDHGGPARFLDICRRNSYTPGVRHRLLRIRSFIIALAWIAFAGTILTHYFDLPAHEWFSHAFEVLMVGWLAVW